MIKLLGLKRAMLLGILLAINILLGVAFATWAMPAKAEAEADLNRVKGEISGLQGKINTIKEDLRVLQADLPRYEALLARGFVQPQDRFVIGRSLEEVKNRTSLMGFSFSVGDIVTVPSNDAKLAGKRLISSRISISKVASLLDAHFFDFIQLLETDYPPHARINKFDIKKQTTVNAQMLQGLGQAPKSLIDANLEVDWLTLDEIPQTPAGTMPGMPGYGGGR